MINLHPTVEKARLFATAAHAAIDQRRKYTGEPYINHPAEVFELVASVTDYWPALAAAWLHDVVEDTAVSIALIESEFGEHVASLVHMLTDVSLPEDGNRAVRKAKDREHLRRASPAAKTVKLADLISNTRSIAERDPGFAHVYLREKAALLPVLVEGDSRLYARACALVHEWVGKLGTRLDCDMPVAPTPEVAVTVTAVAPAVPDAGATRLVPVQLTDAMLRALIGPEPMVLPAVVGAWERRVERWQQRYQDLLDASPYAADAGEPTVEMVKVGVVQENHAIGARHVGVLSASAILEGRVEHGTGLYAKATKFSV